MNHIFSSTILFISHCFYNNAFLRFFQLSLKGFLSLFILFITAKYISSYDFGIFNYLLSIIILFTFLSDFGISNSVSRYTAEYLHTKPSILNNLLPTMILTVVVISTVISFIIIFINFFINDASLSFLPLFLPSIYFIPISSVIDGFYRGLSRFNKLAFTQLIVFLIILPSSIPILYWGGFIGAIVLFNLMNFTHLLFLFIFNDRFIFKPLFSLLRPVLLYSTVIGVSNIAYFLYTRIDIIILEHFGYILEIGYYSIIDRLFLVLFMPAVAIGQALSPNISMLFFKKDIIQINNLFLKYFIFSIMLSSFIVISVVFLFPFFMSNFLPDYFNHIFTSIFYVLLFLIPFKIWGAFLVHGFITPLGYFKITTILTLLGGILNIIFDYISIIRYGVIGVFYTTLFVHSTVISISTVIFLYLFLKKYSSITSRSRKVL